MLTIALYSLIRVNRLKVPGISEGFRELSVELGGAACQAVTSDNADDRQITTAAVDCCLHIQTLRNSFLLLVQHLFFGLLEVSMCHPHATFSKRQQSCFSAYCLDVGT